MHLSISVLLCFCNLGSHWTSKDVWFRVPVLCDPMGVCDRGLATDTNLAPVSSLPKLSIPEIRSFSGFAGGDEFNAALTGVLLSKRNSTGVHLHVVCEAVPYRLVETVQLRDLGGHGYGRRTVGPRVLFYTSGEDRSRSD